MTEKLLLVDSKTSLQLFSQREDVGQIIITIVIIPLFIIIVFFSVFADCSAPFTLNYTFFPPVHSLIL